MIDKLKTLGAILFLIIVLAIPIVGIATGARPVKEITVKDKFLASKNTITGQYTSFYLVDENNINYNVSSLVYGQSEIGDTAHVLLRFIWFYNL